MSDEMTGRDSPKFLLRLPGDMRERIAEHAKANGRSMNAEIVARLRRSLAVSENVDQVRDAELTEEMREDLYKRTQEVELQLQTIRDIMAGRASDVLKINRKE